ncbi:glutamine--fructose-6-phosphate transaminase (isomerizing) [Roseburia sp. MUC/MUC-530-WT-4D]|uniref:Glutamine--fructose-6-phosphate aminotransferase [isomerizing] n=1 Tax=Roseburia porci TaxID=2605790 RepID=A0A6L5YPP0_9FIRM|nr:glutamine--fructose-6-phosphate transaminase (isomerizing) [Roseburia porci]MST74360.1 glutamine--fructose-6-phosphate transaminase (isomerizing) [Roseburia porci]
MCGIIGFTGKLEAQDILLNGLASLEYRGYDSAGIAYFKDTGKISLRKTVGKVKDLRAICDDENNSTCGIGHTRWATHGGVTNANAHPHKVGQIALIHNGIIENYHELVNKFDLADQLISETDTEVAAALINKLYNGDPKEALKKAVAEIEGSFAFCVLFKDHPGEIYAIRNVSPMVATHCEEGSFIASDLTAFIKYNKRYFIVPEYHILTMKEDGIDLEDLNGNAVEPEYLEVNWDVTAAQKDGYPHFMIKEIHEQPQAITRTITPRIKDMLPDFSEDGIPDSFFEDVNDITIVACGTAMYAGMVGKTMIQNRLHIPVTVAIASEFRYEEPVITDKSMVIVVSQSGETIDTLEALRLANKYTKKTLSIVNVKGSSIARESSYVLYTHAGPEIAVASTKAYTVQAATFYLLGCKLALVQNKMSVEEAHEFIQTLSEIPNYIEEVLAQASNVEQLTKRMTNAANAFFIGRGLDYTLCMEGALKLKEISYIHAEAYAAGELKHGTIALISEGVPVIAVATQKHVYSKVISNIREVKARGAYVTLLTREKEITDPSICDVHISLPDIADEFAIFEAVVIFQLIAYYTSVGKGLNPDQPRNLAKSVTVE